MEGDHRHPSPGHEPVRRLNQESVEAVELLVDGDAQGLEDARRGMDPRRAAAAPGGDHDLRELPRRRDRPALARGDDRRADPPGRRLLPEALEDRDDLAQGEPVHEIGGGGAPGRVHPHVERSVLLEREAPLGVVELERRDAEIEEEAVGRSQVELIEDLRQAAEVGVPQDRPRSVRGEPAPRPLQGRRVAIEAEEGAVRTAGPEDRLGMPAGADRAVDVEAAGTDGESGQRLREEDGEMGSFFHVIPDRKAPSDAERRKDLAVFFRQRLPL